MREGQRPRSKKDTTRDVDSYLVSEDRRPT
jgi:hypothetical protein